MRRCEIARTHYRDIDMDLLLTGVILHDIGKIHELTYDRSFGYSTEGQLLGHIAIGMRMIDDKIRAIPDFPERLRTLLQHMILSHHGELEYGSPKVPLFPEALLLHHIDNMDSKMECMRAFIERDRLVDGCWTYLRLVARPLGPEEARSSSRKPYRLQSRRLSPFQPPRPVAVPSQPSIPPTPQPASTASPPSYSRPASAFAEKLKGASGEDS